MSFELTDQGVQVQTVSEILTEMEADARATVHPQLDVSATSPVGQLFGIWAEREMLLQQGVRAVASSFSPSATGQALANVALLTGTNKRGATKSTVSLTVTLTAGTTLPAGSRVNVDGDTNAIFETMASVTNGAGITADVAAQAQAVTAGPVRAASGSLTVINTPVSGWVAATNAFDATVGLDIESDVELRTRREEELRVQGSTVISAIVADVQEVDGVLQARGFENKTLSMDSDGLPGKSFEIVVWDGVSPQASNNEVAQAIFDGAPAGILSAQSGLGTAASGTAIDDEGADQAVLFSRALQKTLYITYAVVVDDAYPVDGDVQLKAAVVTALNAILGVGEDVVATKLYAPAYSITGVVDVIGVALNFTPAPVTTSNLVVGAREIAVPDTSRITVIQV